MKPIKGKNYAPVTIKKCPDTWAEWNERGLWPDWVPMDWRENIEKFWSYFGRKPIQWIEDAVSRGDFFYGKIVEGEKVCYHELVTGRYLHTWNNMCIIVDESGSAHVSSTATGIRVLRTRKRGGG